ncbi:helix-turn-helix transcriptional regulator [Variovorax paradoxus]|nr:helix-turn-helix transcriptional regulator [Variovorax paradoxus]
MSERIKEARDAAKLSNAELARRTGKSQGAVSQWIDGTVNSLRAETAAQLERATGYRAAWIVTGKGPKMVSEAPAPEISLDDALQVLGIAIEAVTDASARASAFSMLTAYMSDPAGNIDMVPLIVKRLSGEAGTHEPKVPFKYVKQTDTPPFNPAAQKPGAQRKKGQ